MVILEQRIVDANFECPYCGATFDLTVGEVLPNYGPVPCEECGEVFMFKVELNIDIKLLARKINEKDI
jgi:predicted Zn finger-like uncharacterized protein